MFHIFCRSVSIYNVWNTEEPVLHTKLSGAQPEPQPCCSPEVMHCGMSAVHVSQDDTEQKMA